MADGLGSFLAGLESGARTGLSMYQTIRQEDRADKEFQLKKDQYAKANEQWDKTYKANRDDAKQTQNNWERNIEFLERQHSDTVDYQNRALDVNDAHYRRSDANNAALTKLRRDDFNENNRRYNTEQQIKMDSAAIANAGYRADGSRITDAAELADVLDKKGLSPNVARLAKNTGLLPEDRYNNYTGIRIVGAPGGQMGFQVAGKDANGKPIKSGAMMSHAGTDDPDDHYVGIDVPTLMRMVDPSYNDGVKSQKLVDDSVMEANNGLSEQEAAIERSLKGNVATAAKSLADIEKQIKQVETAKAKGAQLPEELAKAGFGKGMEVTNMTDDPDTDLSRQRASLIDYDKALSGLQEKRANAADILQGQQKHLSGLADDFNRRRDTATSAIREEGFIAGDSLAKYRESDRFGQGRTLAQKGQEAAFKDAESAKKDIVSTLYKGTKPGEKGSPRTSEMDMSALLDRMSPELTYQMGKDPRVRALVKQATAVVANSGVNMSIDNVVQAIGNGMDPSTYVQASTDKAMAGMDDDTRNAFAYQVDQLVKQGHSYDSAAGKALQQLKQQ